MAKNALIVSQAYPPKRKSMANFQKGLSWRKLLHVDSVSVNTSTSTELVMLLFEMEIHTKFMNPPWEESISVRQQVCDLRLTNDDAG